MSTNKTNQPPVEVSPAEDWKHLELWKRIKELLKDLPEHFTSTIQ